MKLLAWTMSRFNVSPELIGDITEDYSERRSFSRLARQSLVAILSAIRVGLWTHKWLSLRALVVGWVLFFSYLSFVSRLKLPFTVFQPLTMGSFVLYGWAVARAHRTQPLGAAILFALTFMAVILFATIQTYLFYRTQPDWYGFWSLTSTTFCAVLTGALVNSSLRRRRASS